jgi:hypothetical protein
MDGSSFLLGMAAGMALATVLAGAAAVMVSHWARKYPHPEADL